MRHMKNRVLLINPNLTARQSLSEALQDDGFNVLLAETGQQALRTLRDHLVDVVVLDYRTPFIRRDAPADNQKTLEAITDINPFLPVVLTCDRSAEVGHATTLMADLVLTHPVRASALLEAICTVTEETLRERAHRKAGGLRAFCLPAR